VQARNTGTRKGVTVLTNNAGEYRIDDLDAGEYTLLIDWQIDDLAKQEIIGVRPELAGEQLDTGQKLTRDFTLDPRPPKWTELSFVQYRELLPERTGKSETLGGCAQCHGFRWQSLHPRNDIAWSETIDWVVNSFPYHFDTGFYQGYITDEVREKISSYLGSVFGPNPDIPDSPGIARREVADEALGIFFVDYPMPTIRGFPWSAQEDQDGRIWIPQSATNQVARLDPSTGDIQEYRVPARQRAALQEAVPAPDGSVWITATGNNTLYRFSPADESFKTYVPGDNDGAFWIGQYPHGAVLDAGGDVWLSGGNQIVRLDPETETYTFYGEAPLDWKSYTIELGTGSDIWFGRTDNSRFGHINVETGETSEWDSPTPKGRSRQIAIDSDGHAWYGEWSTGNVFQKDSESGDIKVIPIPGEMPMPDALGVDDEDQVWYYSWAQSELGRVNAESGDVVIYPVPYVDMTMRMFNKDSKGRLWFGAPPANRVGYFYLAE
jgi:streptogramin lyase